MSKLFPAKWAEFFFNRRIGSAPTELVVVDKRSRIDPDKMTYNDPYKHLHASLGAHVSGWLDGSNQPGASPEAIFARLWLDVSSDRASIVMGLEQIAKIEECDWARKMLRTMHWIDENWRKPDPDDSEDE